MKVIPHLRLLTEEVRAFERSGRYHEAFAALSHIWDSVDQEPKISGVSVREKASLYLRCGVLAGFLGRFNKNERTQENSKNLLTRAHDLFLELDDEIGLAEAENGLSMAYLRKGELREAEAWIDSSFAREVSVDQFARIESFVFRALILMDSKRYEDALTFLRSVEAFFQQFDDDYLNGCFSANLGICLRNLDRLPEAMQMYNLARHFYRSADNIVYLATVENNLAILYKQEGRFALAHECVDLAMELHSEAQDRSRLGFTYDTRAMIYLDQGKLDEAENAVNEGLEILKDTEITEFLIETLFTKIRIKVARKDVTGSLVAFSQAAELITNLQGAERLEERAAEFARILRSQLSTGLGKILSERIVPGDELELELSPSLLVYSSFDAIWIKNGYLESVGLKKGCLALIVDEAVENGDAIAAVQKGSDEVICGFLDQDFGLLSISRDNDAPEVFKAELVEILGKIVGYANLEDVSDNRLYVRPLKTR